MIFSSPEPVGNNHLCPHVGNERIRFYTGVGAEYAYICPACAQALRTDGVQPPLAQVPKQRFDLLEEDLGHDGVVGSPLVRTRDVGLTVRHQRFFQTSTLLAMDSGMALTCQGLVTLPGGDLVCELDFGPVDLEQPLELYCNPDFVVVVNMLGSSGRAYRRSDGQAILDLDRGTYHTKHCRYSIALRGSMLVHATDWNRLDVTDLRTGQQLTADDTSSPNYFHCGLSLSPNGKYLVDNGWVWHPEGWLTCFDLDVWLQNPQAGAKFQTLCARSYLWDYPLCWLDNTTLAVWGEGEDDLAMLDAVLFFDVSSGEKVGWFAGPQAGAKGWMVFDRCLYAVSPENGTEIWDVSTGERLWKDEDFRPHHYHAGRFYTAEADGLVVSQVTIDD